MKSRPVNATTPTTNPDGNKTFDAAAGTGVTLRKASPMPGAIYPILCSAWWRLPRREAAKKHSD
jgi:hypothetical protein